MSDTIKYVRAREILSGIGRLTVEVEVWTTRGVRAVASVPSGTSRGKYEAFELYDGGDRLGGMGVRNAVRNVNEVIAPVLAGRKVASQREIDLLMLELDGTENKSRLGANAILGVSLAVARASADSALVPLYRHLGNPHACRLPVPMATVLAGGRYSPSPLEFEDYMYVFDGFSQFEEALEALIATRWALEEVLKAKFEVLPDVGGALSPPICDTREAFDMMLLAVSQAGFEGRVSLGVDIAGSDLRSDDGMYAVHGSTMSAGQLGRYLEKLARDYPLVFIEDPFEQDDFESFAELTAALPGLQIVGDDLFVSNARRLELGVRSRAANTILMKVNQVGTVSEILDTGAIASAHGYDTAVSVRSSDTNDSFVADLAVVLEARQIKVGSPVRGERNAKYNRLLQIQAELGAEARFAGCTRSVGGTQEAAASTCSASDSIRK